LLLFRNFNRLLPICLPNSAITAFVTSQSARNLHDFDSRRYEPSTFLDRGVTVPFTTPMLMGARVRPNQDREGLEVIIANPSGASGVYILPWAAIPQICSPTLHDRRLWYLLRDATILSPRIVREAVETAALEGLAGREATQAVSEARAVREAREKRINFALLLNLIRHAEGPNTALPAPQLDDPRHLRLRSQRAVLQSAQQLSMTTAAVANALEELSQALNGFGLPNENEPAPSRELIHDLRRLVAEMGAWREEFPEAFGAATARMLQESLEQTMTCATQSVEEFDLMLGDTFAAIKAWRQDREELHQRLTRLDWLLDGWDLIIGIWDSTPKTERENAIMEMALLAPIMPKEIAGWFGLDVDWARPHRNHKIVRQFEDWRSGRALDMIARNENLIHFQGKSRSRRMEVQRKATKQRPGAGQGSNPFAATVATPAPTHAGKPTSKNARAETRQLVYALAGASDMALASVVEILDRLPDRLEADRILDAARPRLRQLRPARSLQFTRLLFLPLDGAIVDNKEWRRGEANLPRSALPGIAEALRISMAGEAERLEARFSRKIFQDFGAVDRAGPALWSAAVTHAPHLRPGPRWESTGLRDEDFKALVGMAAPVWRHASGLWAAMKMAGWGPPEEAVRAALAPLAQEDNDAFTMGLATIMQKATSPGLVAAAAASLSPRAPAICDAAVDDWLDGARVALPAEGLAMAASLAESFAHAFRDLENAPVTNNPRRGEKLVQIRQDASETCRLAYEEGLDAQILRALPLLCSSATSEQISALEAQARALRRIELVGRKYGIDHGYEGAARRIGAAIHEAKLKLEPAGMSKLDLTRLAEILLGSEMALEILA
jgi:hypothetical protein